MATLHCPVPKKDGGVSQSSQREPGYHHPNDLPSVTAPRLLIVTPHLALLSLHCSPGLPLTW